MHIYERCCFLEVWICLDQKLGNDINPFLLEHIRDEAVTVDSFVQTWGSKHHILQYGGFSAAWVFIFSKKFFDKKFKAMNQMEFHFTNVVL